MNNENKLTKEESIRIVASKGIISTEGVHRVKCTSVTPYHKDRGNGAIQVAIANFNAKSDYQEAAALTLLGQGDYDKAANQGLSMSILQGQFVPTKGQVVDIVVEQLTTNNAPIQSPTKRSTEDIMRMLSGEPEGTNIVQKEAVEEIQAPAFKEA